MSVNPAYEAAQEMKNPALYPQPEVSVPPAQPGYGNMQPTGFQGGYMGPPGPQPGYMGAPPVMQQPVSANTTMVVNMQAPQKTGPRGWSSGTCGCFDDCGICMCVWCCGPCAACQLASDLGEFVCIAMCVPNWLTAVRASVRAKLNIHGGICDDCCMAACCGPCTLCQLMREVKLAKATGQL